MGMIMGLMANNSSPKLSLNLRRVTFCQQKSYFNNPENLQTFMEVKHFFIYLQMIFHYLQMMSNILSLYTTQIS